MVVCIFRPKKPRTTRLWRFHSRRRSCRSSSDTWTRAARASRGRQAYGYRAVPQRAADGTALRGDREIVEAEAVIVRRIFAEFAAGKSPRAIARDLNCENIKGPSGKPWRDTTIRGHATRRTGILRNDLYAGRSLWNKQSYRRNPDTGKRIARPRQQGEHIAVEVPSLRIVDQAVWDAVQARLNAIRASPGSTKQRQSEFWKQRRPKHLLTGLLHCGECGGHDGSHRQGLFGLHGCS